MRLSLPTNWDEKLYEELAGLPIVTYYGKRKEDIIGGGRPSHLLPEVSPAEIERQIKIMHRHKAEFNYVLNGSCLGNREYQPQFKKEFYDLLSWLVDIGVDMVTVSVPYLMEFIKYHFPQLKISASVFCHIDNINLARFYEELGADEITLIQSMNRLVYQLKEFRQALKTDIQIIVNNACLFGCPFRRYHSNINAHSSQAGYPYQKVKIDYPVLNCSYWRLKNPVEIIRSPWVRPEDLHYLEAVGIDKFKIAGRTKSTDWLVRIAKAYALRNSGENTAEIINFPYGSGAVVRGLGKESNFPTVEIFIDNKKLAGFFEFFTDRNCHLTDCDKCGYCEMIAEKTVSIDLEKKVAVMQSYEEMLSLLKREIL